MRRKSSDRVLLIPTSMLGGWGPSRSVEVVAARLRDLVAPVVALLSAIELSMPRYDRAPLLCFLPSVPHDFGLTRRGCVINATVPNVIRKGHPTHFRDFPLRVDLLEPLL